MSDFTHRNLRTDVEDSAPKFGFGETQSARFANETMEAEQTGLSLHTVAPGKRQGFAHRHEAEIPNHARPVRSAPPAQAAPVSDTDFPCFSGYSGVSSFRLIAVFEAGRAVSSGLKIPL